MRAECELAMRAFRARLEEADRANRKKLQERMEELKMLKELQKMLNELTISYKSGGGPKNHAKQISEMWLGGQMYRTLQRLLYEPELHRERHVLLRALRLLEAK